MRWGTRFIAFIADIQNVLKAIRSLTNIAVKVVKQKNVTAKKEYYVQEQKAYSLDWIVTQIVNKHFEELVFLTKEAAEAALKEMSKE